MYLAKVYVNFQLQMYVNKLLQCSYNVGGVVLSKSQKVPYSLYSALLLTRSLWAHFGTQTWGQEDIHYLVLPQMQALVTKAGHCGQGPGWHKLQREPQRRHNQDNHFMLLNHRLLCGGGMRFVMYGLGCVSHVTGVLAVCSAPLLPTHISTAVWDLATLELRVGHFACQSHQNKETVQRKNSGQGNVFLLLVYFISSVSLRWLFVLYHGIVEYSWLSWRAF